MDFITGVGLGNAAIAATAAYGAKDKTFEEKFNERIKVYEDEKKSLEKMIEILKKEKAACKSTKDEPTKVSETRPVEPVPVTETAPVETVTQPAVLPEPPRPEPPQPQPTVEPVNQPLPEPERPLVPETPLIPENEPQPVNVAPLVDFEPAPIVPFDEPEPEPLNQELLPEPALFPDNALPSGPPAAPPESAPEPDVAAAATRRSLYQRSLQDARQSADADVRQFANIPSSDATVSRPLPALPPRPPRSFSRPDFNPSEERLTFAPTRGRTRGGKITRKKKLRTRRATKQKNV